MSRHNLNELKVNLIIRSRSEFNYFQFAVVDALELHAEEHCSDVGEDERLILLHHHALDVAHLVESHQHVAFGSHVDELAVSLVEQRHDVKLAVASFHSVLIEVVVEVDASVGEQHRLVVLVCEILRAVHDQVLRAQARVERIENLLRDVQSVRSGDFLLQLHVVLVSCRDSASRDFSLCDGVEAIKEVCGSVTIGVTHAIPDSVIEFLREPFGDESKHVKRSWSSHLPVTFSRCHITEDGRSCRVRLELAVHRTHEGLQGAVFHVQVEVRGAAWLVGSELRRSADGAHILLVADAGAWSHVLQGVVTADDGLIEEFLAPLSRRLLKFRKRDSNKLSCHDVCRIR